MFARLRKGLILKSKTPEEGETSYIMILKNRSFFLELYRTARLYKNWKEDSSPLEIKIRKYDFTNYLKKIIDGNLRFPDEKEIAILKENIKNLPKKTQDKLYGEGKIEIFHTNSDNYLYNAEIQNVSKINSLSEEIGYKRKLVSWTLPLGFS